MKIRREPIRAGLVLLVWLLTPATIAKVGDIQAVELVILIILGSSVIAQSPKLSVVLHHDLARVLMHHCLFALGAMLLALVSLRLTFYPPGVAHGDLLKTAPFLSLARLLQISLCVGGFILFAQLLSDDVRLLKFAVSIYIGIGVFMACYALVSWAFLSYTGVNLYGAYTPIDFAENIRARALFNEGGPYGLYAVSVIIVALFNRYVLKRMTTPVLWLLVILPVGASLLLSQSKAGAICLVAMLGWRALVRLRFRYLIAGAVALILVTLTTPILQVLEQYWFIYQNFDALALQDKNDANVVAGRLAALSVMPEIVKAHPLLGVGIGNYSLVRGDPKLGVPATNVWDLPGIGLFSYAGDLGIPLFVYLVWIVWLPIRIVTRAPRSDIFLLLAGYQLFAQMIEVQITFFYPWAMSAMAFGYYIHLREPDSLSV
jgi:hypothetical protein